MSKKLTPIETLMSKSEVRCTKCDALYGECDCWVKCDCGWRHGKGEGCKNPDCLEEKRH